MRVAKPWCFEVHGHGTDVCLRHIPDIHHAKRCATHLEHGSVNQSLHKLDTLCVDPW